MGYVVRWLYVVLQRRHQGQARSRCKKDGHVRVLELRLECARWSLLDIVGGVEVLDAVVGVCY
jgi:hypothetical protein